MSAEERRQRQKERQQRQEDRLPFIRLRMAIHHELDGRGIITPAAIGAALGMPAATERARAVERRLEEERLQAVARLEEIRTGYETARIEAARAEEKAEGLRLALEEARRPFWRRWIG